MYRRILLALDGSAMAEQALPVAVNHAKKFQSVLYLIRVINPLTKSYRTGMASISAIEKAEEQLRVIAEDYLDGIANKLKEDNVEVNIATRIGIPYKEIIRFSDQNNIDLIVMGTVCRTGIKGFLIGNTAESIMEDVRCSILALKPQGFVSPISPGKK